MLKCLCIITAFGIPVTIAAYASGKYGTFEPRYQSADKKRPNCEDLGRCNLKTGEVFEYNTPDAQPYQVADSGYTTDPAAYVYLYNDEGAVQ